MPLLMQVEEHLLDKGTCPGGEYIYISDQELLDSGCKKLIERGKSQLIAVDIETNGLVPHTNIIFLISFSIKPGLSYVFDPRKLNTNLFSEVLRTCSVVVHGAHFEWPWFFVKYGIDTNIEFDTQIANQLCSAGLLRGSHLDDVTLHMCGVQLDKKHQKLFPKLHPKSSLTNEQIAYSAGDVCTLLTVREKLIEELKEKELWHIWTDLEKPIIPILGENKAYGVPIDANYIRILENDLFAERDRRQAAFLDYIDKTELEFNINSPAQLLPYFNSIGLNLQSTDEKELLKFKTGVDQYGKPIFKSPVINLLLDYREVSKQLMYTDQWGSQFKNLVTGNVHPNFNQAATETGRFSCLPYDTLISTNRGLIEIKDILVGDQVQTSLGSGLVVDHQNTGLKPVVKLTLSNNQIFRCSKEHKLNSYGDWVQTSELKIGDPVYLSNTPGLFGNNIELQIEKSSAYTTKLSHRLPNQWSIGLAELVGFHIADGYISFSNYNGKPSKISLSFDWDDHDLMNKLATRCIEEFGKHPTYYKHNTCLQLCLSSTDAASLLCQIGASGSSHNIQVPPSLFKAPKEIIAAFLRGYFEGDGCVEVQNGGITVKSVSKSMLESIRKLLTMFGIPSVIFDGSVDPRGYAPRGTLRILGLSGITTFIKEIGFISERKNKDCQYILNKNHKCSWDIFKLPDWFNIDNIKQDYYNFYRNPDNSLDRKHYVSMCHIKTSKTISRFKLQELVNILTNTSKEMQLLKSIVNGNYYQVVIKNIEVEPQVDMYDISIDKLHQYIADGVVVHNSNRPNAQNIPQDNKFRKMIRPPEGYKVSIIDLSQMEVRILAKASGDKKMIGLLQAGYKAKQELDAYLKTINIDKLPDPEKDTNRYNDLLLKYPKLKSYIDVCISSDFHRATAAALFNIKPEEVTKEQRNKAKFITFAIPYGSGPQGISDRSGIPFEEAAQLINKYFKTYPQVKRYLDSCKKMALEKGYTMSPGGRKRFYEIPQQGNEDTDPGRYFKTLGNIERAATNQPIQSGNADAIKLATRYLYPELQKISSFRGECRIIMWVHDEIVCIAPENKIQRVADLTEEAMVKASQYYLQEVPIEVSKEIADTWKK